MTYATKVLLVATVLSLINGNNASYYTRSNYTFSDECNMITRSAQRGETWINGRWDEFSGSNLAIHYNADILNDGARICKYRIHWFSGSTSIWYYPGVNDIKDSGKSDSCWNSQSFENGRRQWSMFADHTHDIIWCNEDCFVTPITSLCDIGDRVEILTEDNAVAFIDKIHYDDRCQYEVYYKDDTTKFANVSSWNLRSYQAAVCENPCRIIHIEDVIVPSAVPATSIPTAQVIDTAVTYQPTPARTESMPDPMTSTAVRPSIDSTTSSQSTTQRKSQFVDAPGLEHHNQDHEHREEQDDKDMMSQIIVGMCTVIICLNCIVLIVLCIYCRRSNRSKVNHIRLEQVVDGEKDTSIFQQE